MVIAECRTNQTLLGPEGHECRVFAVNDKAERPHIMAEALKPSQFDGASHATFIFDEKALRGLRAE